jgi:hypothetical protein
VTADETPAAALRAAAQTLRDLAAAASTDRHGRDTSTWTSHHINTRDARLYGPDRVSIIRGGSSGPHGRGVHPRMTPAHADYIATLHPGVGVALADWLDRMADANDTVNDWTLGVVSTLNLEALAVARLVLGEGAPR